MTRLAFAVMFLAAACSNPRLNAGLSIGPGGVDVTPSISGNVGGMGVSVTP